MPSSKTTLRNNKTISAHTLSLHRRLYLALNLGTRYYHEKEWKWKCTDIETQRQVVRSIGSLLDSVSAQTSHHPLIKDSVGDIVGALVWILQYQSEAILHIAANVAVKLIGTIPNSILQPYLLRLVHPLSCLLSSHQLEVRISCAVALNMILSDLSITRENNIWKILIETKTVFHIVSYMCEFNGSTMSIEYFLEIASLLSTILHRWPPSRYSVWSDAKFIEVLETMRVMPDSSVKVVVLKLYSGLALCGNGAENILQNGESLLQMLALCMSKSQPLSVRMEAFRLAQYLATNGQGCLKMIGFCCEPIFEAVMAGMSGLTLHSGKIASKQMCLLVEACRFALKIFSAGKYHDYFWQKGVDRVLLDLLLENFQDGQSQHMLSLEDQISKAKEGLKTNFLLDLRSYVWEILGSLATHCREDFNPCMHGHEHYLNMLIACACVSLVDSIQKGYQICQTDFADVFRRESASRAVLMMIYSPCKYISSRARLTLSEILKSIGEEHLQDLLHSLNVTSSSNYVVTLTMLQTSTNLVVLACYSCFPQYQSCIIRSGGIKTLIAFVKWCLNNTVRIGRQSLTPHLHNISNQTTCCWVVDEDWEGGDCLLLHGLWGLAELVKSGSVGSTLDIFANQVDYSEAEFVSILREICIGTSAHGPKWYATHILSYFGLYGFPFKLGRRIGKALDESKYVDVKLILSTGVSMSVHGAVLGSRCPSLLPPEKFPPRKKAFEGYSAQLDTVNECGKIEKEIRLSSHVNDQALTKLLEFVYSGYLHAGEELVKKLKILAKHCGLQPLLLVLGRKLPKWGTLFPSFDLAPALNLAGHPFSDIILEAKATESFCWTCSVCFLSVPHVHAHKVVLWSGCDYLQALFQSGMQESDADKIKVPVSWEALIKLVTWFYTDKLPGLPVGCLWDNMDTHRRLNLLQPYVELCWLSEFWFMEDVKDTGYKVIVSGLDSTRSLSIEIIKIAADLSLWKLVEVAASYLAPAYHQLCHSGDLEALDDELVDMIRAASVRLSQEQQ